MFSLHGTERSMPSEAEIRAAVTAKKAQVERFLVYSAQVGGLEMVEEGAAC